jgi:hypothetical protein
LKGLSLGVVFFNTTRKTLRVKDFVFRDFQQKGLSPKAQF